MTGGTGRDTFSFFGFDLLEVRINPDPTGDTIMDYLPGDSGRTATLADRIVDFEQGTDRIDLAGVDAILDDLADAAAGRVNDQFTWVGDKSFSGAAGEARFELRNGFTLVMLEVDGARGVDMVIRLDGSHVLNTDDFSF
jgi:hypothetical protein